ncbi:GntR family transcriptional regulator [Oscillospiraceae bacterium PP1C4]
MEKLILEPKYSSETIGDYSYRMLRRNIICIILKPGDSVSENTVAAALGSSRTPIRETFSKLAADGLIDVHPQRGTYISLIDMKRVKESVFMRATLEEAVMRVACAGISEDQIFRLEANFNQQSFCFNKGKMQEVFELDNKMHELLFEACGMEHVWQAILSIAADSYRIRYLKLSAGVRGEETIAEHLEIIRAIREQDVERGCRLMRDHVAKLDEDVEVLHRQHADYFKNWER